MGTARDDPSLSRALYLQRDLRRTLPLPFAGRDRPQQTSFLVLGGRRGPTASGTPALTQPPSYGKPAQASPETPHPCALVLTKHFLFLRNCPLQPPTAGRGVRSVRGRCRGVRGGRETPPPGCLCSLNNSLACAVPPPLPGIAPALSAGQRDGPHGMLGGRKEEKERRRRPPRRRRHAALASIRGFPRYLLQAPRWGGLCPAAAFGVFFPKYRNSGFSSPWKAAGSAERSDTPPPPPAHGVHVPNRYQGEGRKAESAGTSWRWKRDLEINPQGLKTQNRAGGGCVCF